MWLVYNCWQTYLSINIVIPGNQRSNYAQNLMVVTLLFYQSECCNAYFFFFRVTVLNHVIYVWQQMLNYHSTPIHCVVSHFHSIALPLSFIVCRGLCEYPQAYGIESTALFDV